MPKRPPYNQKTFIARAKEIHRDKYDYTDTIYTKLTEKITFICNRCHEPVTIQAKNHIGSKQCGCRKCGTDNNKAKTNDKQKNFIDKVSKIQKQQGRDYDYSKVKYINNHTSVEIYCNTHQQPFFQLPSLHLKGYTKCEFCSDSNGMTLEKFLERAEKLHPNSNYKYLLNNYNNNNKIYAKSKVTIICPKHGNFTQTVSDHLANDNKKTGERRATGCPECGRIRNSLKHNKPKTGGEGEIINEVNIEDENDVIDDNENNEDEIVAVADTDNDEDEENDVDVLNKKFIERGNEIHGKNKYDYSLVNYVNNNTKVTIICNKCKELGEDNDGEFRQTPYAHLNLEQRCMRCYKRKMSKMTNKTAKKKKEKKQAKIDKKKREKEEVEAGLRCSNPHCNKPKANSGNKQCDYCLEYGKERKAQQNKNSEIINNKLITAGSNSRFCKSCKRYFPKFLFVEIRTKLVSEHINGISEPINALKSKTINLPKCMLCTIEQRQKDRARIRERVEKEMNDEQYQHRLNRKRKWRKANPEKMLEYYRRHNAKIIHKIGPEQYLENKREYAMKLRARNKAEGKRYDISTERKIKNKIYMYVTESANKGVEWNLSNDEAKELFLDKCYYCNAISNNKLNGIDRMDCHVGYISENVVSACKMCNMMKNTQNYKVFIKKCEHIATYNNKINGELNNELFGNYKNIYYANYKSSAKQRNIKFELTTEQFDELTNKKCYLCGKTPNKLHITGIDRIDSSKCYIDDNMSPCCRECNIMKNKYSLNSFLNKCVKIYENYCDDNIDITDEDIECNHIIERVNLNKIPKKILQKRAIKNKKLRHQNALENTNYIATDTYIHNHDTEIINKKG